MIPKTFKLGGRTWRVKRGVRMTKGDYGDCSGSRCRIRLSRRNKSPEEELHTFYHELGHAIEFTLGWRLTHRQIDALGNMLCQFDMTSKT